MIREILQSDEFRELATILIEVFILFLLGKLNSLLSELDKDLKGRDKELLEESVKIRRMLRGLEQRLKENDNYGN
ncbi:hypothetical protein BI308_23155 [Roseofilum reptotaenium AO1-A]|uniref:Uncharacterized protein n=1 Tax=Roseofilum reptotaenium AO1-A TaxID=1925591 RepID=A0A1L9QKI6_9CYAN|nr:hypothetical protein BI308_23155 [Roseofilum reptotaenium AO1-A]